jgi:hypothetical protein
MHIPMKRFALQEKRQVRLIRTVIIASRMVVVHLSTDHRRPSGGGKVVFHECIEHLSKTHVSFPSRINFLSM